MSSTYLTLSQHGIYITLPEETLTLTCPSSGDKNQWMYALQEGIKRAVDKAEDSSGTTVLLPRSPPLVRNASYTFSKNPLYKDATYSGIYWNKNYRKFFLNIQALIIFHKFQPFYCVSIYSGTPPYECFGLQIFQDTRRKLSKFLYQLMSKNLGDK